MRPAQCRNPSCATKPSWPSSRASCLARSPSACTWTSCTGGCAACPHAQRARARMHGQACMHVCVLGACAWGCTRGRACADLRVTASEDTAKHEHPHALSTRLPPARPPARPPRHNHADLQILKNIKGAVDARNSVAHSATVFANAIMHRWVGVRAPGPRLGCVRGCARLCWGCAQGGGRSCPTGAAPLTHSAPLALPHPLCFTLSELLTLRRSPCSAYPAPPSTHTTTTTTTKCIYMQQHHGGPVHAHTHTHTHTTTCSGTTVDQFMHMHAHAHTHIPTHTHPHTHTHTHARTRTPPHAAAPRWTSSCARTWTG